MQNAPKGISLKAGLLILITLVVSASLFAACIVFGAAKIQSHSVSAKAQATKDVAEEAKPVDIANALREKTVTAVYEKESIPAYSYSQIWNMDVSQPSGVTVDDLRQVSRGAFVGLEEAFVKAEKDYGVNCLFVMGIASLESANGTICFKPNNMFGFGNRGFSSKAECIDVVSRALAYNYLTPGGGLYSGKRITDVNRRYAASSTWDEKVCRNMARYYSVISQYHNSQLEKLK